MSDLQTDSGALSEDSAESRAPREVLFPIVTEGRESIESIDEKEGVDRLVRTTLQRYYKQCKVEKRERTANGKSFKIEHKEAILWQQVEAQAGDLSISTYIRLSYELRRIVEAFRHGLDHETVTWEAIEQNVMAKMIKYAESKIEEERAEMFNHYLNALKLESDSRHLSEAERAQMLNYYSNALQLESDLDGLRELIILYRNSTKFREAVYYGLINPAMATQDDIEKAKMIKEINEAKSRAATLGLDPDVVSYGSYQKKAEEVQKNTAKAS